MNETLKGHLFALVTALCWGTSFIVSKTLLTEMTAIQLIWVRFFAAWVTLWIIHPKWHFSWKEEGFFLLVSLFSNTFYFLAENTALQFTQSSNVSILTSTIPLVTALALRLIYGIRMSRAQAAGSVAAFAGVVLVVFNGVFQLKLNPMGDFLALLAAVSWTCYSLLIRKKAGKYNSFLLSRKLMFYGLLTITPVLLCTGKGIPVQSLLNIGNLAKLLYLAVICSALCYMMWNEAIRIIGVSSANVYLYAMPLFTLAGGILFLGEKLTLMGAAGMLLVIAGMLITNLRNKETAFS